ncbi:YqeG family HAD IIIA-type phosphatase [Staphylococcus massiliensis]|uniref:YqeG family HAD IIIA-type phosphatase n=1 Tax=Staphylococcus massiliensis S46 TaxID=1229783 RepID=K9B557_9STAP|nr:YqeG family HAD IIIA-type phosphatase [Staphylococcus massiliensis]EKU49937.1 hypothetical protein C273_03545 [Staphylococcus massiliensis S46]MCG3399041.1 YqeG family HAD IIIA-type phosphatase [Staphylococcus massiliensis]MCG3400961.1 YqeG family HAD IIIA-type phosphatase [Staphylococcus massiliensis]MCG3412497.1 YqeG family HAD IIIA-type phosphatase [Staphylococcus massiliensis]PNZ98936.1 YqeG family HAD IIIA-type phosphatase [Staphylococcus massiliensis CCUG 55927]
MSLIKKYFMPNEYVNSIYEIKPEKLVEMNIKGIITDLDNTLVGWDVEAPTELVERWFKEADAKGIKVTIVSNNNEERVSVFSKPLGVDYICRAHKPRGKSFRKAVDLMNIKPEETLVIGDQMLTDIFGGNRNGLYTIMVVPVKNTDGFTTRINRVFERRLLKYFKRKGYIDWEE